MIRSPRDAGELPEESFHVAVGPGVRGEGEDLTQPALFCDNSLDSLGAVRRTVVGKDRKDRRALRSCPHEDALDSIGVFLLAKRLAQDGRACDVDGHFLRERDRLLGLRGEDHIALRAVESRLGSGEVHLESSVVGTAGVPRLDIS